MFPKVAQKVATAVLIWKWSIGKCGPTCHQFFGYFCMKICRQELLKIAQSGHTGSTSNAVNWSFRFGEIYVRADTHSICAQRKQFRLSRGLFNNLFYKSVIYRSVKFYGIGPSSWCYKTYFGGNLDFHKIKKLKKVCSDVKTLQFLSKTTF